MEDQGDMDWLADEDSPSETTNSQTLPGWRVLIVDDEPDIHSVTKFALEGVIYKGRGLEFHSAYTGMQGMQILQEVPDIALVLLDVVMESEDAGLKLARKIREELNNQLVRVVLRTGQPGQAPERDVILQYDINDYKNKTELSSQKLYTTVIASLRAYEGLILIERNRQGLSKILDATSDLYHVQSLREFASGVLNQISALLDVGADGVLCLSHNQETTQNQSVAQVIAATGRYSECIRDNTLALDASLSDAVTRAFQTRSSQFASSLDVLYVETPGHHKFVVMVSPPWPLAEDQKLLLDLFCQKIGWAFDNVKAYNDLSINRQAIRSIVYEVIESWLNDEKVEIEKFSRKLIPYLEADVNSEQEHSILRAVKARLG